MSSDIFFSIQPWCEQKLHWVYSDAALIWWYSRLKTDLRFVSVLLPVCVVVLCFLQLFYCLSSWSAKCYDTVLHKTSQISCRKFFSNKDTHRTIVCQSFFKRFQIFKLDITKPWKTERIGSEDVGPTPGLMFTQNWVKHLKIKQD